MFSFRHCSKLAIDDALREVVTKGPPPLLLDNSNHTEIIFGLNACLDLISPGVEVLQNAGIIFTSADVAHSIIETPEDLADTFGYFFRRGIAAERIVSNRSLFNDLVAIADSLAQSKYFIGGNAALMAENMARIIAQDLSINAVKPAVSLHGSIGKTLSNLLHTDIIVHSSFSNESENADQVHLILEYSRGSTFSGLTAPTANRFIITHDLVNNRLEPLESFSDSLIRDKISRAHLGLIVLSGVHMLESELTAIQLERLEAIRFTLNSFRSPQKSKLISEEVPVHLELASIADPLLINKVTDIILPEITSLGLNEQELLSLSTLLKGPELSFPPTPGRVASILKFILTQVRDSSPSARLSRIHFHCLSFHVVAIVEGTWISIERSVAAGVMRASRQACEDGLAFSKSIDVDLTSIRMNHSYYLWDDGDGNIGPLRILDLFAPVSSWQLSTERENFKIALAPVLVCKNPKSTVGLGDAISASGLLHSRFKGDKRTRISNNK